MRVSINSARLAPLRGPGYRRLWLSSLVWYLGRWMDVLIASWLALQLTDSAWHVALIGFYRNVPVSLFGTFGGAVADRLDRRLVVIGAEAANVTASFSIAALFVAGWLEYWHLAVANVLLGLAWAIDFPARRSMVPDLVTREQLLPAMVLETISMNFSRALGPLLGGGLLALLGIPEAYLLLAFVYASGIVPLIGLKLPGRSLTRSPASLRFLVEGLRFCRGSAPVRGVLLVTMFMNALAFPYTQILSVFARDVLMVGPAALGLLAAADGTGSLIGAGIIMSRRPQRYGRLFVVSSIGMCLALLVFAVSTVYLVSLAALIAAGIGHAGFSTLQSTITLSSVGEELRGRVMGVLTLAIGSATFGMLLVGAIAGAVSAPLAVGLCSLGSATLVASTAAATPGLLAYREAQPGRASERAAAS